MSREISASSAWGDMHFSELNLVLSDQSDSKSTGLSKRNQPRKTVCELTSTSFVSLTSESREQR